MKSKRKILNEAFGEPITDAEYQLRVRKLLNDRLDDFFADDDDPEPRRPGGVIHTAMVACAWIGDKLQQEYQDAEAKKPREE